jgi:hypothetical protein
MAHTAPNCPKCNSNASVRAKTLLIGKASPRKLGLGERAGYRRKDQLAVDECKAESLSGAPLEQFLQAYYCESCGIGFATDDVLSVK